MYCQSSRNFPSLVPGYGLCGLTEQTATTVSDFMTRKFETIQEADSVKQAAKKMKDNDISSLVVVDRHSNPIGLVTERDIVRKVFVIEE